MLPEHIDLQVISDKQSLARALAELASAHLTRAIEARGSAVLAVSGGSTPKRFFEALATQAIDWSRVTVTLVDDRAVPAQHPRSNVGLVRTHLLTGAAESATFVGLVDAQTGHHTVSAPLVADLATFGMGTDGHTASWFPGGDTLSQALADDGPATLELSAPGAPEPRVTRTWSDLRFARAAVLHIEGQAKAATLAQALQAGPVDAMPIRHLLRQTTVPITIFTDTNPSEAHP